MTPDVRQLTDEELIARHIERVPGRPGRDRASVKDGGAEVWALIAFYKEGAKESVERVAQAYDISVEAVHAALAYYHQERDLIDARLKRMQTD